MIKAGSAFSAIRIMDFSVDEAIETANQVIQSHAHRNLTDVEIIILRGAWEREEYDQIAAQHQYAASYISQDAAPKLWKLLTEALGEKVRKSNFKESLKRHWQQQQTSTPPMNSHPAPAEQDPSNWRRILPGYQAASPPSLSQPQPPSFPLPQSPSFPLPEFYVERPQLEFLCCETLMQPGSLIRIKAPRLMGKSALISRVLAHMTSQHYRIANLSFELADRQTHLTNLDRFLRWFCLNVGRELLLPNHLDEYWDEAGMGTKVSCTTYFEEYLLAQGERPLVLCLDDVDLLFPYPDVYEDFFGLLRSWYEKTRSREVWKKLRLMIVHSTDVYIRLNINQSPFNVGLPIELPELTYEQVQIFAQRHGLPGDATLIDPLIALVGGHPYLLEQALAHLRNYPNATLAELLRAAPTEAGIYRNHLRECWLTLQQEPELLEALKTTVTATQPVRIPAVAAYKLQSMGLVKLSGNDVEPRCQLYRRYFKDRLT